MRRSADSRTMQGERIVHELILLFVALGASPGASPAPQAMAQENGPVDPANRGGPANQGRSHDRADPGQGAAAATTDARGGSSDGGETARELEAEFLALRAAYLDARKRAEEAGEEGVRARLAELFYPRVRRLAERGSGGAALWCIDHLPAGLGGASSERDAAACAAEKEVLYSWIVQRHAAEPWLERSELFALLQGETDSTFGRGRAIQVCDALLRGSSSPSLRGLALYSHARLLAPWDSVSADDIGAAIALYVRVEKLLPGSPLAEAASAARWRLEHLSIGSRAPEFVTEDVFGNEIRLVDYRGKITVVRFWGFWHPDSERIVSENRQLVRRLWDERFLLLGINSDSDPEAFRRECDGRDINWTNAWEGSRTGDVARAWRVDTWPSTFVLDERGYVRLVDLEGGELLRAIDQLVREHRARRAGSLTESGDSEESGDSAEANDSADSDRTGRRP